MYPVVNWRAVLQARVRYERRASQFVLGLNMQGQDIDKGVVEALGQAVRLRVVSRRKLVNDGTRVQKWPGTTSQKWSVTAPHQKKVCSTNN